MTAAARALIAGGGGTLGHALVRQFSQAGWAVDAVVRRPESVASCPAAHAVACDLADPAAAATALDALVQRPGPVDVMVFNVAQLVIGPFETLRHEHFEGAWRASVGAALSCVQAVLPGMLARGRGCLLFSGATASLRGGARFSAFAAAKFALRGLAQSLAREHQARGIHVVHVLLDGLLQGSASVARFGGSEAAALVPDDVARAYVWAAQQPPSAWTHELDLRHRDERF